MTWRQLFSGFGLLALIAGTGSVQAQDFTLTILHNNDVHARLEPTMIRGKAYGGYARTATLIQKFRAQDPNVVVLSAGDTFQGTLFFNVYEGLADLAAMNYMRFDAMAVGNHEFDRGPAPLAKFAQGAKFPVIAANLDVSKDPLLKDLIQPSTVLSVGSEKIGVVGAVTEDLPTISAMGPTVTMKPLVASIQAEVDRLTQSGINKIILLSHCGFSVDQVIAGDLTNVDVIVGGHSHSLLGNLAIENWPRPTGPYPTTQRGKNGEVVLVVQAWEWGKVLGRLKVKFDEKGGIKEILDAAPIPVDESIAEDPILSSMIAALAKPIEALKSEKIGRTDVLLGRDGATGESLMGNVIADSMLAKLEKLGAVAAFMNQGGVRAALEPGEITYGLAITVQPFSNTLVLLDLTGAELKAALEWGVSRLPSGGGGGILLPSAGTSYEVDVQKPSGSRVSNVRVAGAPLDESKTYRIVFNSFTAGGGDGHAILRDAKGVRTDTGYVDVDALIEFIQARSPLQNKAEGRLKITGR